MTEAIYKITNTTFKWKDEIYSVALSPVLYGDEGGLDFTGSYTGLLIDPHRGTMHIDFSLAEEPGHWDIEPKGFIDPNVVDEIVKIISKIESGNPPNNATIKDSN